MVVGDGTGLRNPLTTIALNGLDNWRRVLFIEATRDGRHWWP